MMAVRLYVRGMDDGFLLAVVYGVRCEVGYHRARLWKSGGFRMVYHTVDDSNKDVYTFPLI